MESVQSYLRRLPAIETLREYAQTNELIPSGWRTDCWTGYLRQAVQQCRAEIYSGQQPAVTPESLVHRALVLAQGAEQPSLQRVINATGIVLHTNLGRAPLSERALRHIHHVATGYSTLEYELSEGSRGSRHRHVAERIARLTGAEAALVVNNNAAAVLVVLAAVAAPGEVVVSRGEQVEIGGKFRIPDVIRHSGARLVEVGTTNRTYVADYQAVIGPETAAILKVHTSNYRMVGFVHQPQTTELAQLAQMHEVPLLEDLGSGALLPVMVAGTTEPTVSDCLRAGADVVMFSGDKLLGGGQAGIIAGKQRYLERIAQHPLMRAVRLDKLSLAALEGTLISYELGTAGDEVPVLQLLGRSPAALQQMAEQVVKDFNAAEHGYTIKVVKLDSETGGGTLPALPLPSWGVTVQHQHVNAASLARRLRHSCQPAIGRVQGNQLVLDMRTVLPGEERRLGEALADAYKERETE